MKKIAQQPQEPVILGIETATPAGGVALADLSGRLIAHRWSIAKTGYSRHLLAHIDAMLADAGLRKEQIAAIAVTHGPGSFTGVRVGLTTAKTLAFTLQIPLYLFSTLECAALRWPMEGSTVCVVLDARRNEIYSGIHKILVEGRSEKMRDEKVEPCSSLLETLQSMDQPIWIGGDGVEPNRDVIAQALGERARWIPAPWNRPAADSVALAGARAFASGAPGIDPMLAVPQYLRASDAHKNLALHPL